MPSLGKEQHEANRQAIAEARRRHLARQAAVRAETQHLHAVGLQQGVTLGPTISGLEAIDES